MQNAEKDKAAKVGNKFTPREKLLEGILAAIESARQSEHFSDTMENELWANADLRNKIIFYRNHPLIARKQILGASPDKAKPTVRQFITALLQSVH